MITVVEISASDTHPLRTSVLRRGTVSSEVTFDGDEHGFHLGAFDGAALIGISSWLPLEHAPGFRLRGMATDPTRRGEGIGAHLLTAGVAIATDRGATVVVANARVSALGFYLRHGFETVGDVYVDSDTTGLPHQRIELTIGDRTGPG